MQKYAEVLEGIGRVFIIVIAVAVFVGAAAIIVTMDTGATSQGGRFYVALLAVGALAALGIRYQQLEDRRRPASMREAAYQRHLARSVGLFGVAIAALFALALLLP